MRIHVTGISSKVLILQADRTTKASVSRVRPTILLRKGKYTLTQQEPVALVQLSMVAAPGLPNLILSREMKSTIRLTRGCSSVTLQTSRDSTLVISTR